MKRFLGIAFLVAVASAALYAYVVTRQETWYLEVIEQGDAALAREDTFAAIEAFSVAVAMKPDSMAGHLKRGEAYRRRGQFDSAIRDLRRAAELDPLAPQPREILGDVHAAMGDATAAAERYTEYLGLDDRAPRVLYKLTVTQLEGGQPAVAAATLQRALKLDDRFAEAHYLLGVCLNEVQRAAQAVGPLEKALELNPGLLQAREELAAVYGRLHRHDQQQRQLELLAGLDPRASREVAVALAYARDGRADRAVLRLRNASRAFPDDNQTHTALGRLALGGSEPMAAAEVSRALDALEAATAENPTSEALTLYGRALMASGQLSRAQKVLADATSRFPVDSLAFYYLADVAERRGRIRVAQRALLDYAALEGIASPHLSAGVLARIAEAHLTAGNQSAAWDAAERALKKDPANAQALLVWARLR